MEYRRFIAYFYEYINGKKQKNAGFAKVELRSGVWRILLRLTTEPRPLPPIQVYGFVREKGGLPGFAIGTIRPVQEVVEEWAFRADAPIGKGRYRLEDFAGIWAESADGRCFITVWDDEGIDTERFVPEPPVPEEKEAEQAVPEEEYSGREMKNAGAEEKQAVPEEEQAGREMKNAGAEEKQAVPEEEYSVPEMKNAGTEERQAGRKTDFAADMAESRKTDLVVDAAVREKNNLEVNVSEPWETNSVAAMDAAKPEGGSLPPESAETQETAIQEAETQEAAIQEAEVEETGTQKAKVREASVQETEAQKTEVREVSVQETKAQKASMQRAEAEKTEAQKPEGPALPGVEGQSADGGDCQPREKETPDTCLAEELLRKRTHFQPFTDTEIVECVMIRPCDIVRLQQENWKVGQSSFLQHAFYQHRHLLLGKTGKGTFLLGVPGIRNPHETYMARLFGFDDFKMCGRQNTGQEFGYWCRKLEQGAA